MEKCCKNDVKVRQIAIKKKKAITEKLMIAFLKELYNIYNQGRRRMTRSTDSVGVIG